MRNGSATSDGTAAQASEARKRQHYARPEQTSFFERSVKLTTLQVAVESFSRLGEEGYEFIDELATHAAGGRHGGTMTDPERSLQGEATSGSFGGYAGGHIKEGAKIQARSTWATRSGGSTNDIDIEHIDTNDLGM